MHATLAISIVVAPLFSFVYATKNVNIKINRNSNIRNTLKQLLSQNQSAEGTVSHNFVFPFFFIFSFFFLASLQWCIDYAAARKLQSTLVRRPLFRIIVPNHQNAQKDECESTRGLSSQFATDASRNFCFAIQISQRIRATAKFLTVSWEFTFFICYSPPYI